MDDLNGQGKSFSCTYIRKEDLAAMDSGTHPVINEFTGEISEVVQDIPGETVAYLNMRLKGNHEQAKRYAKDHHLEEWTPLIDLFYDAAPLSALNMEIIHRIKNMSPLNLRKLAKHVKGLEDEASRD